MHFGIYEAYLRLFHNLLSNIKTILRLIPTIILLDQTLLKLLALICFPKVNLKHFLNLEVFYIYFFKILHVELFILSKDCFI